MGRALGGLLGLLALVSPGAAQQSGEPVQPPPHTAPFPELTTGDSPGLAQASYALGPEMVRGRSPREMLADRRKLDRALAALQPQRKGTIDVYLVAVALDSDPVFSREAREAGRVLARRYAAAGRTVTLAGPDGRVADLPKGSLSALTLTLARVAELIDPAEDVLVLYSTSHGAPEGIVYHDGDTGFGVLSPYRLGSMLNELGITRRVILLSACFSGVFVPYLATRDTAIVTAAAADKTSFGCQADNDWTFFGDALVNHALRKPVSLRAASSEAARTIAGWEAGAALQPSEPQVVIGEGVERWLAPLDAKIPREASVPVGRPAVSALPQPGTGPVVPAGRR
ncbi:MAG: C13 family peptidase [Croceibacterium sp.]